MCFLARIPSGGEAASWCSLEQSEQEVKSQQSCHERQFLGILLVGGDISKVQKQRQSKCPLLHPGTSDSSPQCSGSAVLQQ